jgi:hypothetical protein
MNVRMTGLAERETNRRKNYITQKVLAENCNALNLLWNCGMGKGTLLQLALWLGHACSMEYWCYDG